MMKKMMMIVSILFSISAFAQSPDYNRGYGDGFGKGYSAGLVAGAGNDYTVAGNWRCSLDILSGRGDPMPQSSTGHTLLSAVKNLVDSCQRQGGSVDNGLTNAQICTAAIPLAVCTKL